MSLSSLLPAPLRGSWILRNPWRSWSAVAFAIVIGAALAPAAESPQPARVAGHVTGHGRAPLSGARITLSPIEPAQTLTETADSAGAFAFSQVAPGRYRVAVSYHELYGASNEPLRFESGEAYTLDLPMAMSPR